MVGQTHRSRTMALSSHLIAKWSSDSLAAMTKSMNGSRQRMKQLQREIDRAERERARSLCADMRMLDQAQDMEMEALQIYHSHRRSVGVGAGNRNVPHIHTDSGGSAYVETYNGTRASEASYVDFLEWQRQQHMRRAEIRAQASPHMVLVDDLEQQNEALGSEVGRLVVCAGVCRSRSCRTTVR